MRKALDLKSPTCWDCATARGYEAKTAAFTVYTDQCANCEKVTGVSTADDYCRPGAPRHAEDWD